MKNPSTEVYWTANFANINFLQLFLLMRPSPFPIFVTWLTELLQYIVWKVTSWAMCSLSPFQEPTSWPLDYPYHFPGRASFMMSCIPVVFASCSANRRRERATLWRSLWYSGNPCEPMHAHWALPRHTFGTVTSKSAMRFLFLTF